MTKLTRFILAGVFALLAAPAMAQQAQQIRPQQAQVLREAQIATPPVVTAEPQPTSSVVLAAVTPWSPANVDVKAGSTLQIRAEGRWSVNNGQQVVTAAVAQVPYTGPDGYPETGNLEGLILPGANRGALIGKIGENGKPFLIGASYQGTADTDGPLFVSMNEVADQFRDNAGRVGISITVAPPPTTPPPLEQTPTPAPNETTTAPIPPGTGFQPAPPTAEPVVPQNIINIALIVALVFVGLMILSAMFKPRPRVSPDRDREKRDTPSGNVTARVGDDGLAGQSLTISVRH